MAVTFQRMRAGDLHLITEVMIGGEKLVLQRRESDARVEKLREAWDDALAGVITVHRLTDHPTKPLIPHTGDGGTRLRVKQEGDKPDPDYEFDCVVEDVTIRESARRFIGINKDRKAVSKLDEYGVALTSRKGWALAIKAALAKSDLVIARWPEYGNGNGGKVAAVASCEEAVRNAYKVHKKWSLAATHLHTVLGCTRLGFQPVTVTERDDAAYAHDGDLIRAVSRIWLRGDNQAKLTRRSGYDRLVDKLGSHSPAWWKSHAAELSAARAATPGSGGRPQYLAALIVHEYNKRLGEDRRLQNPGRIVID